jgi:hypothetical protein
MSPRKKARRKATRARRPAASATRASAAARRKAAYGTGWAVASDAAQPVGDRANALRRLASSLPDDDAQFKGTLKIVRDTEAPVAVRLAALEALQASSFQVVKFKRHRAGYLAALRSVAADPDPEIRQRVLGFLMREKDAYSEKRLLEGLKNPDKALVPPEKALQLLAYDIHGETYPVAREIVRKPPNQAAKIEALRLLSADAQSAPLFEKLLRNKKEPTEVRRMCASALHAIAPQKLQAHAREIVLDAAENDEVKATSLTALTQFGDQAAVATDQALRKRVGSLKKTGRSKQVKDVATRFIDKYGE